MENQKSNLISWVLVFLKVIITCIIAALICLAVFVIFIIIAFMLDPSPIAPFG